MMFMHRCPDAPVAYPRIHSFGPFSHSIVDEALAGLYSVFTLYKDACTPSLTGAFTVLPSFKKLEEIIATKGFDYDDAINAFRIIAIACLKSQDMMGFTPILPCRIHTLNRMYESDPRAESVDSCYIEREMLRMLRSNYNGLPEPIPTRVQAIHDNRLGDVPDDVRNEEKRIVIMGMLAFILNNYMRINHAITRDIRK
jgi:hypothetical protein